ncbi:MAG: alpha/beta hydrolase [Planctomycetales bacterium]
MRRAWQVVQTYPAARIFIYGESLGGGMAVRLAAECCQKGDVPGGLIVQSSFTSLVEAGGYHFPWLPVSWLLIDRYASIERINKVTCPILVLHGKRDSIVPFSMGRKLFETAAEKSESGVAKEFIELECDHNDVYGYAGVFAAPLKEFFDAWKGK